MVRTNEFAASSLRVWQTARMQSVLFYVTIPINILALNDYEDHRLQVNP